MIWPIFIYYYYLPGIPTWGLMKSYIIGSVLVLAIPYEWVWCDNCRLKWNSSLVQVILSNTETPPPSLPLAGNAFKCFCKLPTLAATRMSDELQLLLLLPGCQNSAKGADFTLVKRLSSDFKNFVGCWICQYSCSNYIASEPLLTLYLPSLLGGKGRALCPPTVCTCLKFTPKWFFFKCQLFIAKIKLKWQCIVGQSTWANAVVYSLDEWVATRKTALSYTSCVYEDVLYSSFEEELLLLSSSILHGPHAEPSEYPEN